MGSPRLFNIHEARSQWPGEEVVLNGGARWPIRRLSWRQLARGCERRSRASCPHVPRLANNTGTFRTARRRRHRRRCHRHRHRRRRRRSSARTTFLRPAPRARPAAAPCLLRAPFLPSPPCYRCGKEKADSGVSTFPCINLSSCRGCVPSAGTRLGRRPWGSGPGTLTPPPQPDVRAAGGGASRGATAGSGGGRPGAGRRTWAGGRCKPARDGLRGGRATAARRGLRRRQTSLPVSAGRRAGPGVALLLLH